MSGENAHDLVKAAVYSRLATDATLLAALGGARVYDQVAPQGVDVPYIIFGVQADRTDTSDPQRKEDFYLMVKAVTGLPPRTAGAIAERVDALLDRLPLTLSGLRNFWLRRAEGVEYLEPSATGGYYVHRGALYRVRVAYS